MQMQSQSSQNFASDQIVLADLVNRVKTREALWALQATNQLLALHARQLIGRSRLRSPRIGPLRSSRPGRSPPRSAHGRCACALRRMALPTPRRPSAALARSGS